MGDLDGLPDTVIQVAAWGDVLRVVREKPIDAERQRERAESTFCATLLRLRGGAWRVVLTPEQFATWAREALAPVPEAFTMRCGVVTLGPATAAAPRGRVRRAGPEFV